MSTMTITKNQTLYRAWQLRESSLSRRASASSDGSVPPSARGGWTYEDGNDQAEAQEALDHHRDSSSRHRCRRHSYGSDEPGRRSPRASQRSQRSHLERQLLQKLGKLWIQPDRQDRPERDHRHMDEQWNDTHRHQL